LSHTAAAATLRISCFQASLYFVVTVLTTVGFGDISAQSNAELVFVVCLMIAGSSLFAFTTATLASIVSSNDLQERAFRTKMETLRNFCSAMKLSKATTREVATVMSVSWRDSVEQSVWQVLDLMSPELRSKVMGEIFTPTVKASSFFRLLEQSPQAPKLTAELVGLLRPIDFHDGSVIAHFGGAPLLQSAD
jgi:potassium voltage-gated channel Eag-related subfamily H protein 8